MSGPIETAAASPSGFDLLLAALDSDHARAADKLLLLRAKLVKYFAWNRASFPDDLADDTLERVARRLSQGEIIRNGDPGAYTYGVARNVLRESWSRPRLVPEAALAPSPEAEQALAERRSRCLDRCLARLPEEERRLLLAYYQAEGPGKAASRLRLAAELQISTGHLRLRLHRMRVRLQGCVRSCLDPETNTPPAHVLSKERSAR